MDRAGRSAAPTEIPETLRSDVRFLGELLGIVLVEDVGLELLEDVENLRALTIAAHGGDDQALESAERLVASFSLERAAEVARAFTCYFHLANTAEEHYRVRALRSRDLEAVDEGTVAGAARQLRDEIGSEETQRRLAELEFHPVFTAHPTEARRRAVAATIRRISKLLVQLDDPRWGSLRRAELKRQLLAEVTVLWRTAPLRTSKPSPLDEVRTVMSIFDTTLFQEIPRLYRRIDIALQPGVEGAAPPIIRPFVRLGSWIGGDRDGNPFVTARTTFDAVGIASEHVLLGLEKHTRRLGRELTLDMKTTPPSTAVLELRALHRDISLDVAREIEKRSPDEPHRQVLLFLAERIEATRKRNADMAYRDADEFLADLQVVQESLVEAGDPRSAYGELQLLMWQVETFGFHFAELEVRQHSRVHAETLAEIAKVGLSSDLSERSRDVLETFRAISRIQKRFGTKAAGRYIVSFTQSAEDLAAVYQLADIATYGNPPVLDVIPLFETFADLNNAVAVLDGASRIPSVKKRWKETEGKIEVMLGYSDSSKDVGPVSAIMALYSAQEAITAWARSHALNLTLFHGRGGALGRGGGPAHRAVLSQPPGSVDGHFKLTEQGEVIFARYGDPDIASRHIDQVGGAILLASAPSIEKRNADAAVVYADLASQLDEVSRHKFHSLVHCEGFAQWFSRVTPADEIGLLALGSRPAKRGLSVDSLEDLRAIPWVFAWTQTRVNLTGWFGLGSALAAVGDIDVLQSAYREWPLFRTMIDNVEMSIAKSDQRIARRYLELGGRADLTAMVMEEMALTREWVLAVTGKTKPLENSHVLGPAIELRSAYVDALSIIQLRALRALREADDATDVPSLQRLLLLTVNGVAAGLQNTG